MRAQRVAEGEGERGQKGKTGLLRSFHSLAMTGVNKNTGLVPYCLSALVPEKAAFTLAEVLITLGIIGIVAAITIPNMISNYRKKLKTTRLQHFYSIMSQAVRMKLDGDSTLDASMLNEAGNPDEMLEFVKTNYAPYMNLTVLKKSQYGVIVGFPDGSGAEFVKRGCTPQSTSCTYMIFCPEYKDCDPSGIQVLDENRIADNAKRFIFWTTSVPYSSLSLKDRDNVLVPNCKRYTEYCTRLLQIDNWEFKKDYPHKI